MRKNNRKKVLSCGTCQMGLVKLGPIIFFPLGNLENLSVRISQKKSFFFRQSQNNCKPIMTYFFAFVIYMVKNSDLFLWLKKFQISRIWHLFSSTQSNRKEDFNFPNNKCFTKIRDFWMTTKKYKITVFFCFRKKSFNFQKYLKTTKNQGQNSK